MQSPLNQPSGNIQLPSLTYPDEIQTQQFTFQEVGNRPILAFAANNVTSQEKAVPQLSEKSQESYYNKVMEQLLTAFNNKEALTVNDIDQLIAHWEAGKKETYQIIGDNIDLLIKTKNMSSERGNRDIHWFLLYAIVDEIHDWTLPDKPSQAYDDIELSTLIPDNTDFEEFKSALTVLWARILVKNIPKFRVLEKCVPWHIPHRYVEEMKQKSKAVRRRLGKYDLC